MSDRENRIRQRAYALWLEQGSPHGRHQEHWDQACHDIDEEDRTGGRKAGCKVETPKATSRKAAKKTIDTAPALPPTQAPENTEAKASGTKRSTPKIAPVETAPAETAKQPQKRRTRAKG